MKPKLHPQHWKQTAKRHLKTTGQLLILALFSALPLLACAVMAIHRILKLLIFVSFRLLGVRTLHWLGWLPRGHSLSTVHDKCSEIWGEFLEDVQFLFWRV